MPRCGACGWEFSDRTLTKHSDTACGEQDIKAISRPHEPTVDDLVRALEEHLGEDLS